MQDKKTEWNGCGTLFILMFVVDGILGPFLFIWAVMNNEVDTEMILLFLGGLFSWVVLYYLFRNQIKEKFNDNKAKRNAKRTVQKDKWEFPVQVFYNEVQRAGINVSSNDDFTKRKLTVIVRNILNQYEISEDYIPRYLERAEKYYKEGKDAYIHEQRLKEQAAKEKKEKDLMTPVAGHMEEVFLKTQAGSKELYQIKTPDKRTRMIRRALAWAEKEIKKNEQYLKLQSSGRIPGLQKEQDWAIAGGIASGLAGSAAGIATALDVQEKNRQIREQNAEIIKGYAQFSGVFDKVRQERFENLQLLKSTCATMQKDLDILKNLIIFEEYNSHSILEGLVISSSCSKQDGGIYVDSTVTVTDKIHVNMPKGLIAQVDGVLKGKVYADNVYIGEVYSALPFDGIPLGESRHIHGSLNMDVKKQNAKYTVDYSDTDFLYVAEGYHTYSIDQVRGPLERISVN